MPAFTCLDLPRTSSGPLQRASSSNSNGMNRAVSLKGLSTRSVRSFKLRCTAEGTSESSPFADGRNSEDMRRSLEACWAKHQSIEPSRSRSSGNFGGSWFTETLDVPTPTAAMSSSDVDEYELVDSETFTPFASAGVARGARTMDGSMEEDIMEVFTIPNPSSLVFGTSGVWGDLDQVYVILFGVGRSDTEGIYSLRALTHEEGLPQDTVVAFESRDDAERYSALLEATMDHTPSVCPIDPQELLEFCLESGYSCRLEADGSILIPPDYNVGMTDWERSLRLREGNFSVLEQHAAAGGDPLAELARQLQYSFPPYLPNGAALYDPQAQEPHPSMEEEEGMMEEEAMSVRLGEVLRSQSLDDIKRRLERLLPEDDD